MNGRTSTNYFNRCLSGDIRLPWRRIGRFESEPPSQNQRPAEEATKQSAGPALSQIKYDRGGNKIRTGRSNSQAWKSKIEAERKDGPKRPERDDAVGRCCPGRADEQGMCLYPSCRTEAFRDHGEALREAIARYVRRIVGYEYERILEEVPEGKKDLAPARIANRSSHGECSQRSSGNHSQKAVLPQEGTPLRRPDLAPLISSA